MINELIISIKLALRSLEASIGRTLLSLLGIVIGVASVIIVLSLGEGVKGYVVGQVEAFGTDIIQIEVKVPAVSKTSSQNATSQVGGTQITTLKLEDAEAVAKLSNIDDWYAASIGQQVVSFRSENKQVMIFGATSGMFEVDKKGEIETGRIYTEDDDKKLRQVVVLGSKIKRDLFGENKAIGENIKIKGQNFEVVGVEKERGVTGFFDMDSAIYMPLRTLQKKVLGIDHIQFAVFQLKDQNKVELAVLEATGVMRDQHDITDPDEDDFAVNSIKEIKDILDQVFFVVNALLLALTSISLIVGGVGIMNVMYVAVTERTFEIGLRKSVGAKNSSLLSQFMLEAVFLTFLGGIIGVFAGFGISQVAEIVSGELGFPIAFSVTWQSILLGFGFSALVGIIFGIYPALKASKMSPMEALRKE